MHIKTNYSIFSPGGSGYGGGGGGGAPVYLYQQTTGAGGGGGGGLGGLGALLPLLALLPLGLIALALPTITTIAPSKSRAIVFTISVFNEGDGIISPFLQIYGRAVVRQGCVQKCSIFWLS